MECSKLKMIHYCSVVIEIHYYVDILNSSDNSSA